MARPIWSGVITFGLVTVPVQAFTATSDHTTHFHQFQRGTGDRVRNQRVNERTGEDVSYDEVVKGYDLGGGDYVMVEQDELSEIAPGKSQTIDIRGFVELDDVDPVYFSRTYYLAPRGDEYTKVYDLLRAALRETGRIGVATFVMRARQYLVALRAQQDVLLLHTMHWADEVRDPHAELPRLPRAEGREGVGEASEKELETARRLVEALSIAWRPEDYQDTYEERVQELIEAKSRGQEVVAEAGPPEATNVIDLMDALQRSVDDAAGRRTGNGGGAAGPSGRSGRAPAKSTGSARPAKSSKSSKSSKGTKGATSSRPATSSKTSKSQESRKRATSPKSAKSVGSGESSKGGAKSAAGGGRGGRRAEELTGLSKKELYERASEAGVPGRSTMSRDELVAALTERPRAAS